MKHILITGKNSYIGTSLEKWLMRDPDKYQVDTIDMVDGSWKEKDFSQYDVVFHVAGIAHVKETVENRDLYFKVNRDLAYETALKAKQDGVSQFVFLSSMSVYGVDNGVINRDTPTMPLTSYGKSKLEAEQLVCVLDDDRFIVSIMRPPMVYGQGCKGNYPKLAALAKKTPVFPDLKNKRSMLYIENFTRFVQEIIDQSRRGLFFPQNSEYVNTSEMVKTIAEVHSKKLILTKFFNPILNILQIDTVKKVVGDLMYGADIANNISDVDFRESIRRSEDSEGAER